MALSSEKEKARLQRAWEGRAQLLVWTLPQTMSYREKS